MCRIQICHVFCLMLLRKWKLILAAAVVCYSFLLLLYLPNALSHNPETRKSNPPSILENVLNLT